MLALARTTVKPRWNTRARALVRDDCVRMNLSAWTMIYRMSRPGENHDSWRRRAMQPRGEAAIFASHGKNMALYARFSAGRSRGAKGAWSPKNSRPTMDRPSCTFDSSLVSESIVKEESGLRYYLAPYSIFFEAPLVTRSVP